MSNNGLLLNIIRKEMIEWILRKKICDFDTKIKDFFLGKFRHEFWKKRLFPLLIVEFIATILLAWAVRPIWVDDKWIYIPFINYISELGMGRSDGNIGAWIFLVGFCIYPVISTGWNSYLCRQFFKVSKEFRVFAVFLWLVFEFSLVNMLFAGIFDGTWPNTRISMNMHYISSANTFLGNVISSALVFLAIVLIYWKTPPEIRQMHHPFKFFLVTAEIVGVYLIFEIFGGPFWEWILMFSLLTFIILVSFLFPENLQLEKQKKQSDEIREKIERYQLNNIAKNIIALFIALLFISSLVLGLLFLPFIETNPPNTTPIETSKTNFYLKYESSNFYFNTIDGYEYHNVKGSLTYKIFSNISGSYMEHLINISNADGSEVLFNTILFKINLDSWKLYYLNNSYYGESHLFFPPDQLVINLNSHLISNYSGTPVYGTVQYTSGRSFWIFENREYLIHSSYVNIEKSGDRSFYLMYDIESGISIQFTSSLLFLKIFNLLNISNGGGSPFILVKSDYQFSSVETPNSNPNSGTFYVLISIFLVVFLFIGLFIIVSHSRNKMKVLRLNQICTFFSPQ